MKKKVDLGCLGVAGLVAGLLVITSYLPREERKRESRIDQIREGCQREFGSEGPERVEDCARQIAVKELIQMERDKMERAAR